MTICFALTLVLVYSIMCLSIQDHVEKPYGINCKVDQQFHSAYVTPLIEQETEVTGCQSSDTSSGLQEVHVLSLQSSGFDEPIGARNGFLPSVSLDVRPRWKQKEHATSVFVILHSLTAVMWQMNLHHFGNSTSFHIIVNKPSYVVPSIAVATVSRQKLPSTKRLPAWVRSHHGAVTSFSVIPVANEIILYTGMDANAAQDCDFSSQAQSINVKGSFVQPQPATGCFVNNSQNDEKYNILHVIELNTSISNADILIHLQPYAVSNSAQKVVVEQNLILVLKCHVPVQWIIESSGIQGSLNIVAEHPVRIRTNPFYITAMVQEKVLPAETSALLSTVQNSYGFIDSYMKTNKANRINIIVKGKTKKLLNEEGTVIESSLNVQESSSGMAVLYAVDKVKSVVTGTGPKVLAEQPLSFLLAKKMILECFVDKMSVAFPFDETMNILTSSVGQQNKLSSVTLIDSSCKAEFNESHIVLQSNWQDCGTKYLLNGDGVAYHNQVQFITTNAVEKISSSNRKHLPTDDDDYISEDGSGSDDVASVRQKSLNEERIIYPVPFHCAQTVPHKNIIAPGEKFELNLYCKKDFQQPIMFQESLPFDVIAHDHLFAEAVIKADPRLCILVDECWISENDAFTRNVGKKSVLIKQGCPTDLSVDILTKTHCSNLDSDAEHHKFRFSFQLSEEFINQKLLLHCRFSSCAMQDNKQLRTKQCISTENFCLKHVLRPYLDTLQGKNFSIIVQGPFRVVSKTPVGKSKDLLSFASPESSTSSPENFVVDYSFDKLTGNNKKNPVSQQLVFIGLSTEAVIGIAFASFIIGAGLMATLWLIHMHTEPSRRLKQNRKKSPKQYHNDDQLNFERTECADNTIPCSVKPLSVHICS